MVSGNKPIINIWDIRQVAKTRLTRPGRIVKSKSYSKKLKKL